METPVTIQQRTIRAALRPLVRITTGCALLFAACMPPAGSIPPTIREPETPDPRREQGDRIRDRSRPPPHTPPTRPTPPSHPPPTSTRERERNEPRARAELVFLGTTDVHNRIYPYDYYTGSETGYGLARLKPLIDSVRAAHP